MRVGQLMKTALLTVLAAIGIVSISGSHAWSQSRFGTFYQEFKSNSCDNFNSDPCTVQFNQLLRAPLKILKASCTILTSEGGSPSKEITGVQLGRVNESGSVWIAGQYLAPLQTEFAGPGQIVINILADTLLFIPKNARPAIRVYRLNSPPIAAQCSIVGEEVATN